MSLNDFVSNIKQGLAKSNHFFVDIALPSKLATSDPTKSNLQKILLFCDQAQLPGTSYGTNQVRTYGEFREVPYERIYEPVQLSFYVDKELYVKHFLENWMNTVQDKTTRDFQYPKYYSTNIDIYVLDTVDQQKYKTTLKYAYPKSVSAVQLDYASKDIMKIQVSFTYKFYETTLMSANSDRSNVGTSVGVSNVVPSSFDYGFGSFDIPKNYFDDFSGFQNQFADFSFDAPKLLSSVENVGERFGFGNIFK